MLKALVQIQYVYGLYIQHNMHNQNTIYAKYYQYLAKVKRSHKILKSFLE